MIIILNKFSFTIIVKIFIPMVDLNYLTFLENILTENRKERFLQVLSKRTNHFTIAMQDIFQLHNTSAVMRSCEVFGIQQLNVIEERYTKSIDKEIAMGAQKWVDVNRFESISNCISTLQSKGYQIIATSPHENDCELDDFDITKPSAFFFGTERDGLSEEVLQKADGFLKIPMAGFGVTMFFVISGFLITFLLILEIKKILHK